MKSVMQKAAIRKAAIRETTLGERSSVIKAGHSTWARAHATGDMAASSAESGVPTKAGVPAKAAAMSNCGVPSAALRPQRQRKKNGERRDRHQATHT
jgi:hypothetical protein